MCVCFPGICCYNYIGFGFVYLSGAIPEMLCSQKLLLMLPEDKTLVNPVQDKLSTCYSIDPALIIIYLIAMLN